MSDSPLEDPDVLGLVCPFDPDAVLARIVVHQAAHHVASYLLGRPATTDLTIPAGGAAAVCEFYPSLRTRADSGRSPRELMTIRVIALLAGVEAEALLRGETDVRPASEADIAIATDIIATVVPKDETTTYATLLRAQTVTLIKTERARGAIFAVADALRDTGSVTGLEATRITSTVLFGADGDVPRALRDRSIQTAVPNDYSGPFRRPRRVQADVR